MDPRDASASKKGENDRGDDEKKDNERDELSHKGGKSHVHGAQPE